MVVCVVRVAGAVAVKYLWEKVECANVILVCPSNSNKNPGLLMHSRVVSRYLSTLSWLAEVRIVGMIDFGKSLLSSINIKTGNKSRLSSFKRHIPQCMIRDLFSGFEVF
jgi:hypothetical protein